MPKVSKESASHVDDMGPLGEDRHEDLDGYTVDFVSLLQESDVAPMLKGLPDDMCQCPHWGYVFKGSVTVHFADREEVYAASHSLYVPAGHTPIAEAGTEILQFSPTEDLQVTNAAIMKNMQAMQAG